MADRLPNESRVVIDKGVDLGKQGTVKSSKLTYQVLVDGRDKLKPYADTSLHAYVPPTTPPNTPPRFDGSATRGFGPWDAIQDGAHDQQFGNSQITIEDGKFRFYVNDRSASNGPRAELGLWGCVREGTTDYIGDILTVPSDPNQRVGWVEKNHDLIQFGHPGHDAPPFRLNIIKRGSGPAILVLLQGDAHALVLGELDNLYDLRIPLTFRVKWSRGDDGEIQTWMAGHDMGTLYGPTLHPTRGGETGSMKSGQYGESDGNVTFWDGMKIGPTYESVQR